MVSSASTPPSGSDPTVGAVPRLSSAASSAAPAVGSLFDPRPYRAAGWQLIPLRVRDKAPLHAEWTTRAYTDDEIDSFIAAGHNIGVRMTPTQVVVDYDPRNDPSGAGLEA